MHPAISGASYGASKRHLSDKIHQTPLADAALSRAA